MDELLKQAIEITIEYGVGSPSIIQRRMRLGYFKANELVDEMERLGVVSSKNNLHPRKLLIKSIDEIQVNKP